MHISQTEIGATDIAFALFLSLVNIFLFLFFA